MSVATDGRLANPWVSGWIGYIEGARSDKFLVQPPFYSVVLAGWLKVFGVSAVSLTGFACTAGWLCSWAIWNLFTALRIGVFAARVGTAVLVLWSLKRGLRPETLALGSVAAGQLVFLKSRSTRAWFVGGLAGSAGVALNPFWVVLAVPATLFHILFNRRDVPAGDRPILGMTMGIGLAVLAFAAGLGSYLPDFVRDFHAHARFVAPDDDRLLIFLDRMSIGYESPVNLILAVTAAGAVLAGFSIARRCAAQIVAGFVVVLCFGLSLYPAQASMVTVLLLAVLPLVLTRDVNGWRSWFALCPALILGSWLTAQHLVQSIADSRIDARAHRVATLEYLSKVTPDRVIFDTATLRYIFDFRPPPGSTDLGWAWSPGVDHRWRSADSIGPRDLWVVNPAWSHKSMPAEAHRGRISVFGRVLNSVGSTRALLLAIGDDLPAPKELPFVRPASP